MRTPAEWNGLKLYWGILHCHIPAKYCHVQELFSPEKIGLLRPEIEQLYRFARDEQKFDFLAYADHHNMGQMIRLGYQDHSPWKTVADMADEYNEAGRFAAIKGYEFQDGMEYNVYLHDTAALPLADRWPDLIAQVKPGDPHILLAAHYRPSPTDWSFALHKNFRLIEIVNDGGAPFEDWANAGLEAGHHAAFIAGSDDHSSRPGRTVATGVWARELSREAIWEGLLNRRCLASMRRRPRLNFRLGDTLMGGCAVAGGKRRFQVEHDCEDEPLTAFLIRNGRAGAEAQKPGRTFAVTLEDAAPARGMGEDYYYLKLIYPDGGVTYTSPIWVRNARGTKRRPPKPESSCARTLPVRYRKARDIGSRVGWHRFVNAGTLAAASPATRLSKEARDMVIHAGPDAILATSSGRIIVPTMDGIREFRLGGKSTQLRAFDSEADLTLLVTGLAEAGGSIFAAGYRGDALFVETLRGKGILTPEGLPAVRPFYFGNKFVTPQYLASDGNLLYCLGERELFVLLPDGGVLARGQEAYPAFPCAVAAAGLARVYVLSCDGTLAAYDLSASQSGRRLWQTRVPGGCVSLLAFDDRVWAFNDRLVPCSMADNIRIREYGQGGRLTDHFALELFNLRGAGLARLPDGRLAGVHNPSRQAAALYREKLNETGRLRILQRWK